MRVIFVPVADRPECAVALRTAFDLAKRLKAIVSGCHIRPHRDSDVSLTDEFAALADLNAAWESAWQSKDTNTSNTAAETLFTKMAQSNDASILKKTDANSSGAIWLEKVGSPDRVLSIMGPVSDLLIVSRPRPNSGKLAKIFMHAALMNSSKPVLIMPQDSSQTVGRRISIAWNQSAEAAKAVTAAMPLLQVADEVNIITCGPETGLGPKSGQLATYLNTWGVNANHVKAKGTDDTQAIMSSVKDTRSDLLVMGAYSRSRLRQRIFGGVTDSILHRENIPVLMYHS